MPELPEITLLSRQMKNELVGRILSDVEVLQPKCLNLPETAFRAALIGARLLNVSQRGKWILVETTQGWLLLNLGMGGEILLVQGDDLPEKRRLVFGFSDGDRLAVNFWWFGYAHHVPVGQLGSHAMIAKLGPNVLDLTANDLRALLKGKRGALKSYLLYQSQMAGIGNFYIHDILFLARLHPLRAANSLSDAEITALAQAIRDGLLPSIAKGGASYEVNLYGQKGGFSMEDVLVGYKEGQPCPACGTAIEKIKTGGASSFICPQCQKLA